MICVHGCDVEHSDCAEELLRRAAKPNPRVPTETNGLNVDTPTETPSMLDETIAPEVETPLIHLPDNSVPSYLNAALKKPGKTHHKTATPVVQAHEPLVVTDGTARSNGLEPADELTDEIVRTHRTQDHKPEASADDDYDFEYDSGDDLDQFAPHD